MRSRFMRNILDYLLRRKNSKVYSFTKFTMEDTIPVKVVLVHPKAKVPKMSTENSAGMDLISCERQTIKPRHRVTINIGIRIEIPKNCYGRIAPRSGLAKKHGIQVLAGVIDSDYRGIIKVLLYNCSDEAFTVEEGGRIAQLICERIYQPRIQQVDSLSDTGRGEKGGINN